MRFLSYLTTLLVAVLFTACGGGGGSPGTTPGGQAFFTTAPSALTLTLGSAQTFTIGGGRAPYSAASSDSSVAVAGLNGTDLTLGAVAPGTADITLRDANGATTAVSVTAKPIRALFTTAPASLTLGVGPTSVQTYQVGGGVGPYVVGNSNPTSLSAVLDGTHLTLTGLGAGAATVVILDNVGASVSIAVTVSTASTMDLFTTASPAVTLSNGVTAIYDIGGGTAPYTATSANTAIAAVSVGGNSLSITAGSSGSTNVAVRDSVGHVVSVAVTVAPATSLFTTAPSSVTIPVGVTASYVVGGGVAPYTATSSDNTVAAVSIAGTALRISGAAVGAATVVVRDNVGATVNVAVTVSAGAALFTTAPPSITLSIGTTTTYSIGGGIAPYTVTSSNATAVQVLRASGNTYTLKAVSVGAGSVVIRDSAGSTVVVAVAVTNTQMSLNPNSAKTFIGLTNYANIVGGVPPYTALSGFASVATVSVGTLSPSGVFTPDPSGNILKIVANQAADPDQIVVTDSLGNSANFSLTSSAGTLQESLNPNALTVSACFAGSVDLFLTGATGTTNLFSSDTTLLTVQPTAVGNGPTAVPVTVTKAAVTPAGVVQITAIDASGATAVSTITITAPATPCP